MSCLIRGATSVLISAVHSGRCGESNGQPEVPLKGKIEAVCIFFFPHRGWLCGTILIFKFWSRQQCGVWKQISVTWWLIIYIKSEVKTVFGGEINPLKWAAIFFWADYIFIYSFIYLVVDFFFFALSSFFFLFELRSASWINISLLIKKTTYVWCTVLHPTDLGTVYMTGRLHGCIYEIAPALRSSPFHGLRCINLVDGFRFSFLIHCSRIPLWCSSVVPQTIEVETMEA